MQNLNQIQAEQRSSCLVLKDVRLLIQMADQGTHHDKGKMQIQTLNTHHLVKDKLIPNEI